MKAIPCLPEWEILDLVCRNIVFLTILNVGRYLMVGAEDSCGQ